MNDKFDFFDGCFGSNGSGRVDHDFVVNRMEEAGATLLALPNTGHTTKLRVSQLAVAAGTDEPAWSPDTRLRLPVPSASRITRMDESYGWLQLIPGERHVMRRLVGARSLVSPATERHLFSWRRLGGLVGADHKAVQRWHRQGIDMIVAALLALKAREGSARQAERV